MHLKFDHPPSTTAPSAISRRRRVFVGLAVSAAVLAPVTLASAAGTDGAARTARGASAPALADLLAGVREAREARNARVEALAATRAEPFTEAPPTTAPPTTTPPTTAAPPPPPPPSPPPPAPEPAPAPSGAYGDPNDPATWDRLAQCESGGNWAANTGNGYYGGLQFSLGSWQAVGGTGYPHEHSRETQIEMGRRLHAQGGWDHWPSCSRQLGYR